MESSRCLSFLMPLHDEKFGWGSWTQCWTAFHTISSAALPKIFACASQHLLRMMTWKLSLRCQLFCNSQTGRANEMTITLCICASPVYFCKPSQHWCRSSSTNSNAARDLKHNSQCAVARCRQVTGLRPESCQAAGWICSPCTYDIGFQWSQMTQWFSLSSWAIRSSRYMGLSCTWHDSKALYKKRPTNSLTLADKLLENVSCNSLFLLRRK